MTTLPLTCPSCGAGDDISIDAYGGAFCMYCEHEWATTAEAAQRAKAARWLSAFADEYGYMVEVHSPCAIFIRAMRKLDPDGDFPSHWSWAEVWMVLAYWIACDEADHGPVEAA